MRRACYSGFPREQLPGKLASVKVALGADEATTLVSALRTHLESKGHAVTTFGAASGVSEPWAKTAVDVAQSVAQRDHDVGIVCCWTGTGVSIAANKIRGIRAALCADAETARGARKWNDANVLALSVRATSDPIAREIVDAWLDTAYAGTEDASLSVIESHDE
jgi:ribose 5-phosphate isomerase B